MFIDEERRIIFIHVAKTAGSSIHVALKDASGWKMGDKRRDDPPPFIHHMPAKDIVQQRPEYSEYYKFAITREPIVRLRSGYIDFLTAADRRDYHMSAKEYGNFEDFCKAFPESAWPADPHFRPQHEMVCDSAGKIMVDIGKYENLRDDLSRIGGKLGFDVNPFGFIEHHRNNQTKRTKFDTTLTAETEKSIKDFFTKDYEIFGYQK